MSFKPYPIALAIAAMPFGASAADSQLSEIVIKAERDDGQTAHVQVSQIEGINVYGELDSGLFGFVIHPFQ